MSKEKKIISPQAGFQEKFVRSNVDFVVGGGVLNPQPLDGLIATPNGFIRMGDIKVGDIICDTKGGTQVVNLVIDKGLQPCVEFTLSDGRVVYSALSHNWRVRDRHNKIKEITAQQIIDYYNKEIELSKGRKYGKRNLLKLPLTLPTCYSDVYKEERTIHPYILGYIIGDGSMSKNASKPDIFTKDKEVVDRFISLGYDAIHKDYAANEITYTICNKEIKHQLIKLGIWGHTAPNKFIPKAYKYAPIEDRLELLKGLFDADGCCTFTEKSKSPRVSYVTISEQLAKDVQEIIYSLGGICNIYEKEPYIRDWGDKISYCLKSYTLYPHIYDDRELFYLPRKKDRCKDDSQRSHKLGLAIQSYRILPPKEMRCINVSGEEHLYLTDNYVVTCNCGKTFAAVLSVAEPSKDSNFKGLFLRNNLGDAKAAGGILDTFRDIYGSSVDVVESGDPRVTFKESGAKCDVTHVADQSYEKVMQRFKGRQYDYIYFDEGTGFSWECFTAIYTRNRGTAKWTGKVRMTTNPDRNHWLRTFLDWYIGVDGFILEEREGVVRYFYINGETVKDVVWGDSKESVYKQCKIDIDRKLKKINGTNGTATYEDMVKSFTFYLGRMSENKASLGNNTGYVGSVAVSGGRMAEQLLEGNWNVSPSEALDAPIPSDMANQVFMNDDQRNGDKWVTCDLADTGTDNFLAIAWDGFHIIDILILGQTTPRQNAERLEMFAAQHNISNTHIIYDAIRGTYINDYIPEAIPYFSYAHTRGMYGRMADKLKDECYLRLVEMIKRGGISMDDRVAKKVYEHQKLRENISIQNEFLEECAVVRFKEVANGRKKLLTKREMNQKLGRGRSMDLLDPCAMRMMPILELPYGEELIGTISQDDDYDDDDYSGNKSSIYDDSIWC